ncbi:DHA2 family efflux MFS transporter permease subunit [Secundilactobacillus silagei]|uniref:Major facilitator superfamily transporter n=1 Tax=Secundilactobacillus silagei JCM 19001 TaxID=1302250 RepID=A0A1Z5IIP9_9LACO|nr:DHA2 family efflux MFS transporter permease subunit [Secundilactobacillus silagei]TDG72900.1 hypothetical protein C5L25_002189 [Secundilactobacillus silagei JCM 19001]GAX01576.1 major facilitator superfamily transporter [Secundilactobacillus silagei JCM 19001]
MNDKIPSRVIGAVVATGLMSFCGVVVETAMNITFPTLMQEFHVATDTVQWMTTLYMLVVASMVPLSATLKHRFKTKQLFLSAITLFIIGVVLDAIAPNFTILLLGRGIQGLGTGISLPLMFNIILEQVPQPKIGAMMGVGTLITGVAPAIGPTFGGTLIAMLNWRYIFILLLPLLIFALILGLFCIEQKSPIVHANIDTISVILIVLTFCGLIFGISNIGSTRLVSVSVAGALLLGVIALGLFIFRSTRIAHPIINLSLLGNQFFSGHLIAFALLEIIALGVSFLLPNYIQIVNRSSALQAGLIVLPGAALGAIAAPLSGRLYDYVGGRLPLRSGGLIALLGIAAFMLMSHHLNDMLIIFLYIIFMVGIGSSFGNLMTNGLQQLNRTDQTDGNALFSTVQQFCGAVGTSLAAAIIAAGQAETASLSVGTATGSFHVLILFVILSLAELVIIIWATNKPVTH